MFKRLMIFFYCCLLLVTVVGCKSNTSRISLPFDKEIKSQKLKGTLIAENNNYRMEFDKTNYSFVISNKRTGEVYYSSPITEQDENSSSIMPKKRHDMVESALVVNYHDTGTDSDKLVYSYSGAIKNGRIVCENIKNGIKIQYYFDDLEFMIPVEYVLYDEYISVSINPAEIQEEKNIITSIGIAPFCCAVKNDTEDSYLFVPSGSGALASTQTISRQGLSYSAQVYGYDLSMKRYYLPANDKEIRLPVYGMKNGDVAVCAIIDKAPETAWIEATVGAEAYEYSTVYSNFQIRGYTDHQAEIFSSIVNQRIYSDYKIDTVVGVRFYPLEGENANYTGMSKAFRNYLTETKALGSKKTNDILLNVNFIGGTQIKKSFLGVPYTTVFSSTTISDVCDIVGQLSSVLEGKVSINLKGFGESGIDIGKIAGGYKLNSNIGTKADLLKLAELCKDEKYDLYMDFDITRFNSSGSGASIFGDSIMSVGNQRNYLYLYDKSVKDELKNYKYKLISPSKFDTISQKLAKEVSSWGLAGISLSSASTLCYSDYADKENKNYFSRTDFDSAVNKAISNVKGKNFKFCSSDANLYAAQNSDVILDVPTNSSGEYMFFDDVPFYEMVFSGYIPMTVESVNLSSDPEKLLLKAVEAGVSLNYTMIASWDNALINSQYPIFYSSNYKSVKKTILSNIEFVSDYYEKISGSAIVSHDILESGLRVTTFDNGISVYVNYSDETLQSPYGDVLPSNFLILEKPI